MSLVTFLLYGVEAILLGITAVLVGVAAVIIKRMIKEIR